MYYHSLGGDRSMPATVKRRSSLYSKSAAIPTEIPTGTDDRVALRKIGVAAISLFLSFVASVPGVILELEGIGRAFWIALQLISLASFVTAIVLLVREMISQRTKKAIRTNAPLSSPGR